MKNKNEGGAINSSPERKQGKEAQQKEEVRFDYDKQAWVVDGRYQRCGHVNEDCGCYGKLHEGELVDVVSAPDTHVLTPTEQWRIDNLTEAAFLQAFPLYDPFQGESPCWQYPHITALHLKNIERMLLSHPNAKTPLL